MIGNVITALREGNILRNPVAWKNRQVVVNAVAGVLGALVAIAKGFGYDIPVTDETLASFGAGIWAIVSVFNVWGTAATTEKIGLLPGNGTNP